MTSYQSKFIESVTERGFMHQCTALEALDQLLSDQADSAPVTAYIGFDCTAPSLHAGSLVPIMLLRQFQKAGHRPIVLMGGGTTMVGDPSGKDASRVLLDDAAIAKNMDSIKNIFSSFLTFGDGPTDAIMVNNADWLTDLQYIPFLRDYGRHFSINRMLGFDSVKLRLDREQPLSFLEFNYMILQAYDFAELANRHQCRLQMGGSDQWGNIINGVELGRRTAGHTLFGLTSPLLTTASGAKMGKTADGAVWLNADMLSAYDYWQYWRNTEDADVGRFLKLFTDLPLDEISRLSSLEGAEINDAKKILADEATALCHSAEAAKAARSTAEQTFEAGQMDEGLPTIETSRATLEVGIAAFMLFKQAGLASSNGEARRLIKGGGARLNDVQIKNEMLTISIDDLTEEGVLKLSAGKKRHVLVRTA